MLAVNDQFMFVLIVLKKIKEMRLKFFQGSVIVLWVMTNYQEPRVKQTNTQLKKLKFAAKIKTGTILRINKESFQDEELPHELFIRIRQTTKID